MADWCMLSVLPSRHLLALSRCVGKPLISKALGSYLSFDLMAETVFGRATRMLEAADSRFIVDLLGNAAHRIGILSQMPELASWKLDRLLFPTISKRRDKFVQLSKKMAVDKMQTEENRGQDIFSCILAAKDPESGEGFPMSELWAESALLMVAGKHQTLFHQS